MKVLQFIAAVFVGVLIGSLVIWLMQLLENNLFPIDKNLLPAEATFTEIINQAPSTAIVLIVFGYALGSFVGGLLAQLIFRSSKMIEALTTGVSLCALGAVSLSALQPPVWFMAVCLATFIPAAYFGGWLVRKKNNAHAATA
jgi:NhaP-type Na+/H+ or K+/H+ antiporter